MIDLVKIKITDRKTIARLRNQDMELLKVGFREEAINKETYQFEDHYLTFENDCVYIILRPHYIQNNSLHNANRFFPAQCIDLLKKVMERLKIAPDLSRVINLEFGINYLQPFPVEKAIRRFHFHDKRPRQNNRGIYSYIFNAEGATNYFHKAIKLYAKGLQPAKNSTYQNFQLKYCDRNMIRYEIKSTRTKYINGLGIETIDDLLQPQTYLTLIGVLRAEFESFLILDNITPIEKFNFSQTQEKKFEKYLNPETWEDFINGKRNLFSKNKNSNKYSYHNLLENYSENIRNIFRKCVNDELDILEKGCNLNTSQKSKKGAVCNVIMVSNCTPRVCPVTGVDISMQKENSHLLSNTGLKKIEEDEAETFEWLKSILLTGEENKFEKSIYDKMSKQIRNRYYNNRPKYNTQTLFNY